LPSVALGWQASSPSGDRAALRVLARFESGNPRHPAVDVRGEDAAELLPLLRERRVLLEPALMQLRFVDEPLRLCGKYQSNASHLRQSMKSFQAIAKHGAAWFQFQKLLGLGSP
jgi:hypothetical protein